MIRYLLIEEVMAIHQTMIELFGGREDVHDFTMLHSAIERCKATFAGKDLYPTIFDKAAALIQSLILNHPFDDGNKRTAFTSCALFLFYNHYQLIYLKKEVIKFTLDIDSHKLNFEQISHWLKNHSKKIKR
ncbi:MAG: type II toxin-antitoxin system death-on-curing family toxin [Candidatus Microgenomates bacterium]